MKDKIQEVLNEIRVALQQDGGDIELVSVDENTGVVRVELQGRCRGCPYSQMTLTGYVEKVLKERIPEITEVLNHSVFVGAKYNNPKIMPIQISKFQSFLSIFPL